MKEEHETRARKTRLDLGGDRRETFKGFCGLVHCGFWSCTLCVYVCLWVGKGKRGTKKQWNEMNVTEWIYEWMNEPTNECITNTKRKRRKLLLRRQRQRMFHITHETPPLLRHSLAVTPTSALQYPLPRPRPTPTRLQLLVGNWNWLNEVFGNTLTWLKI